MTMNSDVFLSLLALDSYNRRYGQNVGGLSNIGQIGTATILTDSVVALGNGTTDSGFYAIAYQWQGQTVISFRGTNIQEGIPPLADAWNGWKLGAGFASASQGQLAIKFYEAVSGLGSIFDTTAGTTTFTGHSLGGDVILTDHSLAVVTATNDNTRSMQRRAA